MTSKKRKLQSTDDDTSQARAALCVAASNGDDEKVKTLISGSIAVLPVDSRDAVFSSALLAAAEWNHVAVLKVLIGANADINTEDDDHWTPLCHAAAKGHIAATELLLAAGASQDQQNADQKTPLILAAEAGHLEVVQLLLSQSDCDLNPLIRHDGLPPLLIAIARGDTRRLRRYLHQHVDINIAWKKGISPLSLAITSGRAEMVSLLVEAKATLTSLDGGMKPLTLASLQGKGEIVEVLLHANANPNATSGEVKTALFHAVEKNNVGIVKTLIAARADGASRYDEGRQMLNIALRSGFTEILKLLLKSANELIPKAGENLTIDALSYAAYYDNIDILHALIDVKADLEKRGISGYNALMVAACQKKSNILRELLRLGADVHATTPSKQSALMITSSPEVVDILVAAKASVDATDWRGKTPLSYALESLRVDVVARLLKYGASIKDPNGECMLLNFLKGLDESLDFGRYNRTVATQQSAIITLLLDAKADISSKKIDDQDVFTWSVDRLYSPIIEKFFDEGVTLNAKNKHGYTALIAAANSGNVDAVKVLLSRKADVNATADDGDTALTKAALETQIEVLRLLIDAGARFAPRAPRQVKALMQAVGDEDVDMVKLLVEANVNINGVPGTNKIPIFKAIQYRQKEILRILLNAGARTNIRNANGDTPLSFAVKLRRLCAIEALLNAKADPNVLDHSNRSLLKIAVDMRESGIVELLLKAGARADLGYETNDSCLFNGVYFLSNETIQRLIDAKANLNAVSVDKTTPLMRAMNVGNVATVKLLLKSGAKSNCPGAKENVLFKTLSFLGIDMLRAVVDAGADVNERDPADNGATLLLKLLTRPQLSMAKMKYLVEHGARLDMCDELGRTPLMLAASRREVIAVEYLLHETCLQYGIPLPPGVSDHLPEYRYPADTEGLGSFSRP